MAEQPESAFVMVGGLRLHYLTWGEPSAPPLLLLHGLGESARAWSPVAPRLTERFRVLALDLRGHGNSDWHETYAMQEIGDDAGEMIGALGLGQAVVAGIGLGGRAAALLAARQEHTVERLVVIEAGVRMNLPAEHAADMAVFDLPRRYNAPGEYSEAWNVMRRQISLRLRDEDLGVASEERLRAEVRAISTGGFAPTCDLDGYAEYRRWSPGERVVDYHDEFHEIGAAALVVRGAWSTILTADEARATTAAIAGARLMAVEDAAHDILVDNPAGLAAVILDFLR